MKKYKFITYMNYGKTHGFWVRLGETQKRVKHHKLFPVLRHGGKRKAQKAALEWRDKILKEHYNGRIDTQYNDRRSRLRPKTDSNVLGVTFSERWRADRDSLERNWLAQCSRMINGRMRHKTRSFSIGYYGYDEAFKLACEARKELEAYMDEYQAKMMDVEQYV